MAPKEHPGLEAAKKALNALFSNTSVSRQVTREALEELRDEIKMSLDALECDDKD